MNFLARVLLEVIGWRPQDEARAEARASRDRTETPFGPRKVTSDGECDSQWLYGANRMVDMACKVSDDLAWWYDEDTEQFVVRNSEYDMERREDELWRAMWILERDIRIEHGTKWHNDDERSDY